MMIKSRLEVLDKILDRLKVGIIPWHNGLLNDRNPKQPFNPITNTTYKGMNDFYLKIHSYINNYDDPRFITFNQAKKKGYSVKKGSKSIPIEFYCLYDTKMKTKIDWKDLDKLKKLLALNDDEFRKYKEKNLKIFTRVYGVFNASQIDGIDEYERMQMSDVEKLKNNEKIDSIITNSKARIKFNDELKAYYNFNKDFISLPHISEYKDMDSYYSTALHELSHWTGHKTRLDRNFSTNISIQERAKEELVAEFSYMFISNEVVVKPKEKIFDNSVSYISHWITMLENNSNDFFSAIRDAEKASEYILNLSKDKFSCGDLEKENKAPQREL